MPQWTKEQKDAINARGRNILVSAAAGSGKTAVLVERVIKIITDIDNPVDIDRLLVVTFTNAAAAEMKSRISAALKEQLKNGNDIENIRRQLSLLPSARICTIDSFCINIVREYFYLLNISQDFSTMDESELSLLQDRIISDVIAEYFEASDDEFIGLYEQFTTPNSDKQLVSVIKRFLQYIYAQPFPYQWAECVIKQYEPDVPLSDTVWCDYIKNEIEYLINYCDELIDESVSVISDDLSEPALKVLDVLEDDRNLVKFIKNKLSLSWDELVSGYDVKFRTMARTTKLDSKAAERIKANRETYKSILTGDIPSFLISTEEEYNEDMKILMPRLSKLLEVVREVDSRLGKEKREKNSFSFSDIEHFAIDLMYRIDGDGNIIRTEIGEKQSAEFYEILVDEYQDTNEAQDMLFRFLSNGRNLFTVGDVKQSIYRFRLAMPSIFTGKRSAYTDYCEGDNSTSSKIILDKNFRSTKGICSYVNFVFSNLMTERVGELDYNESEYLNYGADYDDSVLTPAQINLVTGVKGEEAAKKEAALIAKLIKEKVEAHEQIKDGASYRDIRYGDFAIFMRSLKSHISDYAEVLTKFGIPVICDNSTNLFENNEIRMIMSLLRVIDNPTLDIPLLSTMLSPIYSFSPDELARIRIDNRKKSFYYSVSKSQDSKVLAFINDLKELKKLSVTMSVAGFIRYLVEDKGIVSLVNAMGNGEQRYQNILKLISFAKSFDNGSTIGMTSFIRYIDKIIASDKSVDSAPLGISDENAVKIMSIHHSKGLQFPVCILAGASRGYNKRDLSDKFLFNTALGFGIKVHNEEKLYQYQSLPYAVIKSKNSIEAMSENLRVLYVALTRAKEQFITFAYCDNHEKLITRLSNNISNGRINPYICSKINNDAELLLMCAILHPDGSVLREITDSATVPQDTDFRLDVNIIEPSENDESVAEEKPIKPDINIVEEIRNKLAYKYERQELSVLSAKLVASSLDGNDDDFDYLTSSKPAFLSKKGMTPAERGTAMHTFMQYCDYNKASLNIDDEIERLKRDGYITPEQADVLDKASLNTFFKSQLGIQLCNATRIYREFKVSSFVPANEIYDTDFADDVLIQGVADCVFEADNKLYLLDYKTDNVSSEEELLSRYRKQIDFYKKAVSKTLDMPVEKAMLYSFKLSKICQYK